MREKKEEELGRYFLECGTIPGHTILKRGSALDNTIFFFLFIFVFSFSEIE